MATFLTGEKVTLRTLTHSDLPAITQWVNDQETTQYLNLHRPMMLENENKWYDHLVGSTADIVLAVEALTSGKTTLIGIMGIHGINHREQRAETGAMFGEKNYLGKGYGTAAKILLLHWAFNELNLRKITSSVLATNPRSKKYLEKTGYKEVGRRKAHYLVGGTFVDEILMEVFRDDFMKVWTKYSEK